VSKEQILISKIDSLLDQVTEHQKSGLTADYRLYFSEGYKYALQEWKNEIESSDFDVFVNNLPSIASNIERSLLIFRKGTSHHPEAIKGRKQANEDIKQLIKVIL
jgi:hypothetical protein